MLKKQVDRNIKFLVIFRKIINFLIRMSGSEEIITIERAGSILTIRIQVRDHLVEGNLGLGIIHYTYILYKLIIHFNWSYQS